MQRVFLPSLAVEKGLLVCASQVKLSVCNAAGSGLNSSSSNPVLQYPQTSSMQQQPSPASQPPAGASYLPPSSSSFLVPNHFGGNSDGRNGSIHLPLGVSHVDPDSYLTSPTQSGLVNPIQTGMGSLTNPSHSGLSNAHQLAFANPVQTGMGNPSQAAGLYQRPSSAQPQGSRQNMQVIPYCCCDIAKGDMVMPLFALASPIVQQ